jgi:hypothetical protein
MWVIPPLLPGASRADREWHRREVTLTERELKDVWTNVCMVTHLAQVIPAPRATLQAPVISSITLDSVPPRFTVKLRPGQLPGDFARRAERFAAAFRVPAVEVATLTADNQWISVRLLEPYWIEWPEDELLDVLPAEEPRPALSDEAEDDDTADADDGRAVAGGPPSMRRRRHRSTRQLESGSVREPATGFGSVLRYLGDFWRLPAP